MAKQPEGISLLGKDLIRQAQTRSDTAARKAAKREEKAALIGAGFEAFKTFKMSSVFENAILLNDKALTFNFFARSKTLAWGLLVST